jgi:hypothetical protein
MNTANGVKNTVNGAKLSAKELNFSYPNYSNQPGGTMAQQSLSVKSEKNDLLVYLIFFLSLCYLAFLVSSAQPGVFFSSDGGVKYIVVKQLTEGHGYKYMYLPQPQWVQQIWGNGYFPFKPPFLYASPGGYLFVFPPAFQIISSFFYSRFGNAGLYVIPIVSTVLLWLWVVVLLKRCGIAASRIAAGLFVLVFCSPLTIYGATYWEHMTAILLLFGGVVFVVRPPSGVVMGLLMGLLSGLAAWFRPEALMMNVLYGLAAVAMFVRERKRGGLGMLGAVIPAFLVGIALGVGSFLVFNQIEFHSWFGLHSYQVLNNSIEEGVERSSFHNLITNNLINIRHYLFVLLLLPAAYVVVVNRKKLDFRTILLIAIALVYCVVTPFMVPNDGGRQWGARYFLPIIPVVLVALLLIEKEWHLLQAPTLPVLLTMGVVILFAGYCFERNVIKGGIKTLRWENRHRISPSIDFINRQESNVVVVAYPYIAMELGYLFDRKYFFLAPDDSSLQRLLPLLKEQGVRQYTYIYDVRVPGTKPRMLADSTAHWPREMGDFEFTRYTIQ